MYRYEFSLEGRKQLHKLSPEIQKVVINKLDYFIASEKPIAYAKRLHHYPSGSYRFRVGDYRIIFDVKEQILVILAIGHRREIYK